MGGRAGRGLPFSAVVGVIAGLAIFATSQIEIRDIDLFWHILAGQELAAGTPADSIGLAWSYAPDPNPWTSTQWLAELALSWIHSVAGWAGIAAFRVITNAIALAALASTTLRGRPVALAALPFTLAAGAMTITAQERPQQLTFIGAAVLGGVLLRGLQQGSLPRWWLLLPVTILWANIHGGWVLVPGVLVLVGLGRMLDHGIRDSTARRALLLGAMTLLAGVISPAGVGNLTAIGRFSDAASTVIAEWQATVPMEGVGWMTVLFVLLVGIAWAHSRSVPRSELLITLGLLVFSWTAWRNLVPALLLVAPLVANRLVTAYPKVGRRPEPSWSVPFGIAAAAVFTVAALAVLPTREHLPVEEYPIALAHRIAELPAPQRVLNDYNVAGMVLLFGGPRTQVGIDGRTDRYGPEYITTFTDMDSLAGDWESTFDELAPFTSALLTSDSPLAHVLVEERGWVEVGEENDYVLLVPAPGATG